MNAMAISYLDALKEWLDRSWIAATLTALTIILSVIWLDQSRGPDNGGCQPGQGPFIAQSATPDSITPCMTDFIMGGEYEAIPPGGITIEIRRP